MGRYRKIDPRIWNDQKFRTLSDNGKLTFLFVLTHPHMTSLGAMRATPSGLGEELGWTHKAFGEAFQEVLGKGLLRYDPEAACLVIPNFLKYNPPENPNVIKSWEKILDLIPECGLQVELFQSIKAFLEGYGEPFRKALPKELERVCQTPNPSPNPIIPPLTPQGGNGKRKGKRVKPQPQFSPDFEIFWDAYPNSSGGKDKAWERWQLRKEAGSLPPIEYLLESVSRLSLSPKWQEENGKYIPMITTFINQGRWTDAGAIKPGNGSAPQKARNPSCPRCRGKGLYESGTMPDGSPAFLNCKCEKKDDQAAAN